MILGGGIIRSGGNTKIIMIIDIVGTWCIGIPLCLLAAYVFKWGIVGVYTLLTTEELLSKLIMYTHLLLISTVQISRAYCSFFYYNIFIVSEQYALGIWTVEISNK